MPNIVHTETEPAGSFHQVGRVRSHTFQADVLEETGGTDSAPGPHDYFDAALATCKAATATWYARRHGIPLERVQVDVERHGEEERQGKYGLKVTLAFHGQLTAEQRTRLYAAVSACPIHKLMTTADIVIETAPLAD
jgi:putative redox protein